MVPAMGSSGLVSSRKGDDSHAPRLTEAQQGVLESLRRDGIAVVSFHELFGDERWDDLQTDIGAFVDETERRLDEYRR